MPLENSNEKKSTNPGAGSPAEAGKQGVPMTPVAKNREVQNIRWWHYLALLPVAILSRAWSLTVKIRAAKNSPSPLEKLGEIPGGVIYLFWHNRIFLAAELRRRFRPGGKINVLASANKDGTWIAAIAKLHNGGCIRGSSSFRGGVAMLELARKLDAAEDIVITPDGPRGPIYNLKNGTAALAKKMRHPIVLIHSRYFKAHRFASWDGFYLPFPFSRVEISVEILEENDPAFALSDDDFTALLQEKMRAGTNDTGIEWHPKRRRK